MTSPPPDLRARVLAAARETPSPVRADVKRSFGVALAAGLAALGAVLVSTGGLHLGARPVAYVVVTAVGWAGASVVATVLAFGRGRSAVGRPSAVLWGTACAVAPALALWALGWALPWPELDEVRVGWQTHFTCFFMAAGSGMVPLLALLAVKRHTDPLHPVALGAALGGAAGAWSGTMMDLHCAASGAFHVTFAHACPSLLLAFVGALVGGRMLGIHAKPL